MSQGTLWGVGLGPGDPELVTVKAARVIAQADVVAYHSARHGRSIARGIAVQNPGFRCLEDARERCERYAARRLRPTIYAPSLPIASTGQPSIASLQRPSSSEVSGCL